MDGFDPIPVVVQMGYGLWVQIRETNQRMNRKPVCGRNNLPESGLACVYPIWGIWPGPNSSRFGTGHRMQGRLSIRQPQWFGYRRIGLALPYATTLVNGGDQHSNGSGSPHPFR